jgi:hypothetical protein
MPEPIREQLRYLWTCDLIFAKIPMSVTDESGTAREVQILVWEANADQLLQLREYHVRGARECLALYAAQPDSHVAEATARHMLYANIAHQNYQKRTRQDQSGELPFPVS